MRVNLHDDPQAWPDDTTARPLRVAAWFVLAVVTLTILLAIGGLF